ncbi:hypothetical protein Q2941_47290 [Bradyrhizobium sp. UFLA05-153]|nr:hypothetical protein [Bradyrhizobium sp. Ec3.3]
MAALPKAVHDRPEWQAAMEALILVAERASPTMFARIGIMRALNRGRVARCRARPRSYEHLDRRRHEAISVWEQRTPIRC